MLSNGEKVEQWPICSQNKRPLTSGGPDGCGKHESPKATVKQLKQGFVDDNQFYQLENY